MNPTHEEYARAKINGLEERADRAMEKYKWHDEYARKAFNDYARYSAEAEELRESLEGE